MPKQITISDLKIKEFNIIPDGEDFILTSVYALITDTGIEMPAVRKTVKWKDIPQEQTKAIDSQVLGCKKFSDLLNLAQSFIKSLEKI